MSMDDDSSPDLPYISDEKPCLICGDKSDGTHFGVESCRACAAFFRRTVVSEKKYYCQGFENCDVSKNARCVCRCCRFRKCYTTGMRQDMVQGRRDPIIPRIKNERHSFSMDFEEPSTSKDFSFSSMSLRHSVKVECEEPTLLYKILHNYRKLRISRKTVELSMDPSLVTRMHTSGPLAGYALGSSTKLSKFNRANAPVLRDFALSTFEEFAQLSKEDQQHLFPAFLALSWGCDISYQTYRQVPKHMYDNIMIVSETTYLDTNKCEQWLGELNLGPTVVMADVIKTMKEARSKAKMKQLYIMTDMKIEEEEYAALLGLLLWNQNFETGGDEMDAFVKKMREKIFNQLEMYYKICGRYSYAARLGELMGLHGTIVVDAVRFKEDMEVFNLLQAIEKDDVVYESLRNNKCF